MVSNTPPEELIDAYFLDVCEEGRLRSVIHPRAVIVAGISGSGKTTYIDGKEWENFFIIQPDKFRKMHPNLLVLIEKYGIEYAHKYTGHFSYRFATEILDRAIDTRFNIVYETTFANRETAHHLIEKFKMARYHIEIHAFEANVTLSIERNRRRFEYKKDISDTLPRIVNAAVIEKMKEGFLSNLEYFNLDDAIELFSVKN